MLGFHSVVSERKSPGLGAREPGCHGLNVCVPPSSYVESLMPNVMVLEGGPLEVLKLLGWNRHIWDRCLMEEDPENSLPLLPCEDT